MKNILIPTDFSNNAAHAISYALNLFKGERTNIFLLHAYADEVYGPYKKGDTTSIDHQKKLVGESSSNQMDKQIKEIIVQYHNPKHSFKSVATFDSLVDGVNDFVNAKDIDLIIMGTKGQTADKTITFGSHTVQIFKYVNCPVLAIPDGYKYKAPKKILFPSAYMLPYKRRELKLLDTLALRFKSQIHSLYISDFEDLSRRQLDNKKFLKDSLPNAILTFKTTSVKNKAVAIMHYISENNMDLLVMVNSRHSFFEDMLYRSTIDEIGLNPILPFLVMQNLPR